MGVLGAQEAFEGQTSDRERYHLDREGCERIKEGRGRVADKFHNKTLPLQTWLLHLASLCGQKLYGKYRTGYASAESLHLLPCIIGLL